MRGRGGGSGMERLKGGEVGGGNLEEGWGRNKLWVER